MCETSFKIPFQRPFDAKNPFLAQVIAWKELHKGGDRSCMHIELDISNSKLRYDAGKLVLIDWSTHLRVRQ